jgi:PadR family transcriptional regulator PadR
LQYNVYVYAWHPTWHRARTRIWETQIRKGWLDLVILASLWKEKLYGLDIIRRLEAHSELLLSEGTIYPILGRLKRDGFVDAEWVESDAGHPRKYYWLTPSGRRRAAAWRATPRRFSPASTR